MFNKYSIDYIILHNDAILQEYALLFYYYQSVPNYYFDIIKNK
jgi:hypothetical protein